MKIPQPDQPTRKPSCIPLDRAVRPGESSNKENNRATINEPNPLPRLSKRFSILNAVPRDSGTVTLTRNTLVAFPAKPRKKPAGDGESINRYYR